MKNKADYFLIFSLIVFMVSLTQRTYCVDGDCGGYWNGIYCFFIGIIGLLTGGVVLSWLANPLLILAWATYTRKTNASLLFSILGAGVGLSFLTFDRIMINVGGGYGQITGIEIGYWLWVASMGIMVVGNIYKVILKKMKS